MSLSINTLPTLMLTEDVSDSILNTDILHKIEDDLAIDEKISILFLMSNDYTRGYQKVYSLLEKYKTQKAHILVGFIDEHLLNWKKKLLEAIWIIQNRKIIRKLGFPFQDLDLLCFPKNRMFSRYLNVLAKCLYLLCEALSGERTKLLLQYVRQDMLEYTESLSDTDFLELHILYWIEKDYISIDDKVNLKNLFKHIKKFDELELIYKDLEEYECKKNESDVRCKNSASRIELDVLSIREDALSNVEEENIVKLHKGLCIIINQMVFENQKLETRFGTWADCTNLSETFKGFGFTVKLFSNLKKDEILRKLEGIPLEFGTDYDCVFVCILSHGFKGGIFSSDEEEVSIEAIEHKFCSIELKDIIKIVIIQACQGISTEIRKDTAAPVKCDISNILAHRNFCIFMSTMQGFISVRHKEEGSWFIQEFCNVLRGNGRKTTFFGIVRKTTESVMKKRGKLNGTNSVAQLPELRSCRLLNDFQLPEYHPPNE